MYLYTVSLESIIIFDLGLRWMVFLIVLTGRSLGLFVKASPDGTTGAQLSSSLRTFEKVEYVKKKPINSETLCF